MKFRVAALLAGAVLAATPVLAQQAIQWRFLSSLPKGGEMPPGVTPDILGIELGDTYDEAKRKLAGLTAEALPGSTTTREIGVRNYIESATGQKFVAESLGGTIEYTRNVPSKAPGKAVNELMSLNFTTPATGHQLISVVREIRFPVEDQPNPDDVMAAIKRKYQGELVLGASSNTGNLYDMFFGRGRATRPPVGANCYVWTSVSEMTSVATLNQQGQCDVIVRLQFSYGISPKHLSRMTVTISGLQRMKTSSLIESQYMQDYMKQILSSTGGGVPKL